MKKAKSFTITANTHKKYIEKFNLAYGTDIAYKMRRCTADYDHDTIIWMIRFYRENDGFINEWLDDDHILQRCVRPDECYAGKPIQLPKEQYRLVVSIEDWHGKRVYEIKGLFKIADGESDPMNLHFVRVSQRQFEEHMPELFE